jgi:hypothetical protein
MQRAGDQGKGRNVIRKDRFRHIAEFHVLGVIVDLGLDGPVKPVFDHFRAR